MLVRPVSGKGEVMKADDERNRGKHLRGRGRGVRPACLVRLLAAYDLRLFQSAWSSGTRGQAEHEEHDGQQVELVHLCESGW